MTKEASKTGEILASRHPMESTHPKIKKSQLNLRLYFYCIVHKQTHNTNFQIMRLLTHNFLKSNVKGYVLKRIVYTWCGWSTGLFRRERLFI